MIHPRVRIDVSDYYTVQIVVDLASAGQPQTCVAKHFTVTIMFTHIDSYQLDQHLISQLPFPLLKDSKHLQKVLVKTIDDNNLLISHLEGTTRHMGENRTGQKGTKKHTSRHLISGPAPHSCRLRPAKTARRRNSVFGWSTPSETVQASRAAKCRPLRPPVTLSSSTAPEQSWNHDR